MAIQWADSFSRYGTGSASNTAMKDGLPYNNWLSQAVTDPDPAAAAAGERCVLLNSGLNNDPLTENRIALRTPSAGTVGVAARYWFNSFGSGTARRCIAVFANNTPTALVSCRVEANGALTIVEGLTGAVIATTTSPMISTNTWNHIETSYNGTTGAIEVRVNGITRVSGTAVTTGTTYFAFPINRIGAASGSGMYVKDLVIWDGTGSRNNSFLGSVVVRRRPPVSDVTLGGWLPSTGSTGYNLLAKTAVNDSTYLSADDSPPAPMQYNIQDLPDDVTSVKAVIAVVRAKKIDGGDANLQTSIISNGTPGDGADRPITSAFSYWYDVFEVDPDTGSGWTPQAFNDATVEINRTV